MDLDNDILINQARQLYAALQPRYLMAVDPEASRLEHLIGRAYARYLRRLNYCSICYAYRDHDCIRDPGEKSIPCHLEKFTPPDSEIGTR